MTNTDTCVACKCCFGLLIDVTGFDVHRLVRSLLLDAASLVTTAPSEELDDDLGFCLEPGGETFTLILRQRGTASPRCALLLGPMGAGAETRCGVYPIRPAACRSYPAELEPGPKGGMRRRSIARCPIGSFTASAAASGAPTEAMDESWRPLVRDEQIGVDVHRIVTWRWNRHVLVADRRFRLADLLAYLIDVHDRLDPTWNRLTHRRDWPALREAWGHGLDAGTSPFLARPYETPELDAVRPLLHRIVATIEASFPDDPW